MIQSLTYFWKKWINDYLPTLTRRSKWCETNAPLECFDVVAVVDDNMPRNYWQKGVVVEATKSKDVQVRCLVVQTSTGITTIHITVPLTTQLVCKKASTSGNKQDII